MNRSLPCDHLTFPSMLFIIRFLIAATTNSDVSVQSSSPADEEPSCLSVSGRWVSRREKNLEGDAQSSDQRFYPPAHGQLSLRVHILIAEILQSKYGLQDDLPSYLAITCSLMTNRSPGVCTRSTDNVHDLLVSVCADDSLSLFVCVTAAR
eukprot:755102-Hanusia_phi.AAC.2